MWLEVNERLNSTSFVLLFNILWVTWPHCFPYIESRSQNERHTHIAFPCINPFIHPRGCGTPGSGPSGTSRLVGTYSIGVDPELSGMNSSAAEVEVSRAL